METSDSRQSGFNASRFRDAIGFAMKMGIPDDLDERVTFQWNSIPSYDASDPVDARGVPYDWTTAPASTVTADDVPASLTVPVSIEFFDSKTASGETVVGDFDKSRIKVFMLDTSYDLLTDSALGLPDRLITDGNTYDIEYWAPPVSLFTVTTYTCYASARDES